MARSIVIKYLRSYKNLARAYDEGLGIVRSDLDRIYSELRLDFRDLRNQKYFVFNGKNSEQSRPYEQ